MDKIIKTYNNVFLNSNTVVVEYNDVLKCPFFVLFTSLIKNEEFKNIFDMNEFMNMSNDDLYYYYITRKDSNVLKTLNIKQNAFDNIFNKNIDLLYKWIETFMYEEIDLFQEFTEFDLKFNFVDVLKRLINTKIVKNIFIFSENKSINIEKDISRLFGNNATYVYGSLEDIITNNNIDNDTTFVFSNIKNILVLDKIKKLNLSTVLIADKFGYNYKEDDETPIVDIDSLYENNIFKFSFFNNILS